MKSNQAKTIQAQGFRNVDDYLEGRGCVCLSECGTVVEAKMRARYYISEDFRKSGECAEALKYSQVVVDGEVRYDYGERF